MYFFQFQLEHLPQNYNGSALTLIESLSRYNILPEFLWLLVISLIIYDPFSVS